MHQCIFAQATTIHTGVADRSILNSRKSRRPGRSHPQTQRSLDPLPLGLHERLRQHKGSGRLRDQPVILITNLGLGKGRSI